MGRRNCASCRFYERSSIARMGWCRHPELYAGHHNHLVSADDLDCDRGTGDFWESVEADGEANRDDCVWRPTGRPIITVTSTGSPVFPVTGSSGYQDDPPPPVPGGGGGPSWGDGDRDLNYYSEERYWTDYIRIIAPIVGVIVLVIILWVWIASFLGDDDSGEAANATGTLPVTTLTAAESQTPEGNTTPSPPGTAATATSPGGGSTAVTTPSAAPTTDGGNGGPVAIYLGATVEVANTDGTGVNVRADATTSSEVLTVFLDGTQIQVIDGPVDAEGFEWWKITGNEVSEGWIVSDYLKVVE